MKPSRETTILAHLDPEAAGKPYLGDPAVVDRLVRGYVMGLWDTTVAVSTGQMPKDQATAANQAAAQAFMTVIAGCDPAYVPLGGWNANETGGLKSFIRKALGDLMHPGMLAREPDGPYEALAAYLMRETYQLLAQSSELSEQQMRDRLDGIFDDGHRILLGLPSNQDMDDTCRRAPHDAP
jgi:hypothetical protein